MSVDPPYSDEAERGALGSMLISADALNLAAKSTKPEQFYIYAHRTIYEQLLDLWNDNQCFDLITFTQHLRNNGLLEKVGGPAFVTELFTFVPSPLNIEYYLEIIREKFSLREIIRICGEALSSARNQTEPDAILAQVQADLLKIGTTGTTDRPTIKDFAFEALESLEEAYKNKGKMVGLSTGLKDLDYTFGGMQPGQLIIVAGPTGGGKTSLGLKIAGSIAVNAMVQHIPVGIISLEMSGREIAESLIGSIGRVDMHSFAMKGTEEDFPRITSAVAKISESLLHIRDDSDVTFTQMRALGRELKTSHQIQLLIMDYLQILVPASTKDENRERAMSAAAQACKQMARELNIPVIAMSQLNEAGKLRESRAIGHHADKVAVIEHSEDEPGKAFIKIEKNRRGPTGIVPVTWIAKFSTFENSSPIQFDKK